MVGLTVGAFELMVTVLIQQSKYLEQAQKGADFAKDAVLTIDETLFADNMAQIGGAVVAKSSEVCLKSRLR